MRALLPHALVDAGRSNTDALQRSVRVCDRAERAAAGGGEGQHTRATACRFAQLAQRGYRLSG